ncbi:uncharacterized protein G2W53_002492 [Senna tora]|uniref:Uncharacterized protein n=1 Tax=Senna tora TaxID=362788 RepID=A0A834XKN1_9FABA|nr:uncharacterized protein G2W53_002492 [Senna tora]
MSLKLKPLVDETQDIVEAKGYLKQRGIDVSKGKVVLRAHVPVRAPRAALRCNSYSTIVFHIHLAPRLHHRPYHIINVSSPIHTNTITIKAEIS